MCVRLLSGFQQRQVEPVTRFTVMCLRSSKRPENGTFCFSRAKEEHYLCLKKQKIVQLWKRSNKFLSVSSCIPLKCHIRSCCGIILASGELYRSPSTHFDFQLQENHDQQVTINSPGPVSKSNTGFFCSLIYFWNSFSSMIFNGR